MLVSLGLFYFMSLEILKQRLEGSHYDPVIWEDIKPLEKRIETLELIVDELFTILDSLGHIDDITLKYLKSIQK